VILLDARDRPAGAEVPADGQGQLVAVTSPADDAGRFWRDAEA
jgi:hypothetical protein